MSDLKIGKNFGNVTFGEFNSISAFDFEKSFNKYFNEKFKSEYEKNFGRVKFGELDNKFIKDFEDFLSL
ncbi:MAG: hypothetical protein ACTSQG_00920 [Promethearchaeota archaeon]